MTHTYAIHGYGVWLPSDVAEEFRKRYASDPETGVDADATLDEVAYDCGGSCVGGDSDLDGVTMYLVNDAGEGDGMFLYSDRQGSVFASDSALLYEDLDDMVRSIRDDCGKWLPDDFDIRAHIGEFLATYSD